MLAKVYRTYVKPALPQAARSAISRVANSRLLNPAPRLYHRKSWWLAWPLVRQLRCLQLRRVTVLYPERARGTPVVRYYWGRFLAKHRDDIRGRVLEIGETSTVRAFGGSQIQQATAIDIAPTSSEVTIVADLARADHVEPDQFDCFVNQFTMHIIDDFKAALYHSIRLLKPAGVLLINFPARSGYDLKGAGRACVYHWFTPAGVEKALADLGMTKDDYELTTYGNFLSLTAYMAGIPVEELTNRELDYEERDIPLLICAKVVKPLHWPAHLKLWGIGFWSEPLSWLL